MLQQPISFFNQNLKLVGTLYKPGGEAPYPAIVVHPASAGERTDPFYDHLKSELPRHGIAVLVFDRRGSGTSEGNPQTAEFEDLAGDVIAAVDALATRPDIDRSRIGLHGTSQGAWIAPIVAARKPEIACIVAVSACGVPPAQQMDYGVAFHLRQMDLDKAIVQKVLELRALVNEYFRGHIRREQAASQLSVYESEPWFEKSYLYSSRDLPADPRESIWYYQMDYEPLSIWAQVTQPTLFLFAETDEWVPLEASMRNYRSATAHLKDVTLKQIKGTNHLMSASGDENVLDISQDYLSVLLDWLTSHLRA
jgi:dipeptidyl aminopeptidase/acylaminoacyl peptidase